MLAIQKATGIAWKEITEGRRAFTTAGGGDKLMEVIGKYEGRLAKLAQVGEIKMDDLYKSLWSYMNTAKMTPEAALKALEINFAQGKAGAFELKDMAKAFPELMPAALSLGMTGEQATQSLGALLQIWRDSTGSTGQASTLARNFLKQITNSGYIERIKEGTGLDIVAERKKAIAEGKDPLMHVMNLLADKLREAGPARRKARQGKRARYRR